MTNNVPVVNAGLLYVNGLQLSRASTTTLTLAAGAARDSGNTNDITLSAAATINGAVVGANGCDVQALEASTMYAVYVIGDSTQYNATAGLLSKNLTQPSLPGAYDMYRRVGYIKTDGSSLILQFWQYGSDETRVMYYDVGISVLAGGAQTSFTAVDLSAAVPVTATQAYFDIAYTPNAATNKAEFLPGGSSASNGIVRYGCGVAAAQIGALIMPTQAVSSVAKILYKVAASDALTLLVSGYTDYLR